MAIAICILTTYVECLPISPLIEASIQWHRRQYHNNMKVQKIYLECRTADELLEYKTWHNYVQ